MIKRTISASRNCFWPRIHSHFLHLLCDWPALFKNLLSAWLLTDHRTENVTWILQACRKIREAHSWEYTGDEICLHQNHFDRNPKLPRASMKPETVYRLKWLTARCCKSACDQGFLRALHPKLGTSPAFGSRKLSFIGPLCSAPP